MTSRPSVLSMAVLFAAVSVLAGAPEAWARGKGGGHHASAPRGGGAHRSAPRPAPHHSNPPRPSKPKAPPKPRSKPAPQNSNRSKIAPKAAKAPKTTPRSPGMLARSTPTTPKSAKGSSATPQVASAASANRGASTRSGAGSRISNVRTLTSTGSTTAGISGGWMRTRRSYHSVSSRRWLGRRYSRGYSYGNRSGMYHQLTRSIVTQLRKTHSNLARLDRDYQGHRVRAMRAIGHAIRVLGNRSGRYFGSSQTLRTGMNRNLNLGGAGRGRRMSQAQSDARMRQSLRSLQSIHGQLMNSSGITRHARATSPVRQAIGELGTALNIR